LLLTRAAYAPERTLKANKNVTEIIAVDPKTLEETTIFKR